MKEKKILFVGPIYPPETGPGIKNRFIIDELKQTFKILEVNTLKREYYKLAFLFTCNVIILSVSTKGRFVLGPMLYFYSKLLGRKLILIPAGGSFGKELESLKPWMKKFYISLFKKFDKIYLQTPNLYEEFKSKGFNNAEYLSNMRPAFNRPAEYQANNKFIYLSSIKKEKGIEDCIKAIDLLRKKGYNASLTVYGRIQEQYKSRFLDKIAQYNIEYKGLLPNSAVLDELCNYTALLLPTYYNGEGHPGVLVECSIVGLPFVITRFGEIDRIYQDNVHACYVEKQNPEALSASLKQLIDNPKSLCSINKNLINKSKGYSPKVVLKDLVSFINQ